MSTLLRSLLSSVALLSALSVPSSARAVFIYSVDDGTAEDAIGLGDGGDLWWANQFTAVPAGQTITSLSVAFGSSVGTPDPTLNGTAVQFLLYNDVDNDGTPNDLVLLASAPAVIASIDTDTFITAAIAPTAVSGSFFVAALVTHAAGLFPAALDETTSVGQSWFAGTLTAGAFDETDVVGSSDFPPSLVTDGGFPGNWLIRADGIAVTPEPSTMALMLLAGVGGFGYRRRRRVVEDAV